MPCYTEKTPNGGVVIMCTRGRRGPKPCARCGRPSTRLCDHRIGGSMTCSTPMCERPECGQHVAKNRDLCAQHMGGEG